MVKMTWVPKLELEHLNFFESIIPDERVNADIN